MKFEIFKKNTQTQTNNLQKMTKGMNNLISEIKVLRQEEYISVAGGPQVENDPVIN